MYGDVSIVVSMKPSGILNMISAVQAMQCKLSIPNSFVVRNPLRMQSLHDVDVYFIPQNRPKWLAQQLWMP